jgi:hypothetical protein
MDCDFMLPSMLSDKNYSDGRSAIAVGDIYSIRLDHGLIAQLHEMPNPISRPGSLANGEVVILVNAFEFSDTVEGAATHRFSDMMDDVRLGTPSLAEARVVYYSPDVEEKQDLNFSNIPISGPIMYNGRPIGIQIIVLELDRVSESTKSLLKSLADLGKTYVAPSMVNSVLVSLGKSLIDGNNDDVVFEYRMVLDNSANLADQITPTFTSGRYVFRRVQKRTNPAIWNNLRVDENTGALMVWQQDSTTVTSTGDKGQQKRETKYTGGVKRAPYTQETYFTINVLNHGKDGIVAHYANEKWEDVSKKIDDALNSPNLPAAAVTTVIQDATAQRQSIGAMVDLNKAMIPVIVKWKAYMATPKGDPTTIDHTTFPDYVAPATGRIDGCGVKWDALAAKVAQNNLLKQQAMLETANLVALWKRSLVPDATGKVPLRDDEYDVALQQFVEKIHHTFGVLPDDAYTSFGDRTLFTQAYLGTTSDALGSVFTTMVTPLKPDIPKTCAQLP